MLKENKSQQAFNGSTWNTESRTTACGLYHHIGRFPFIIALIICKGILSYTKSLTTSLQG